MLVIQLKYLEGKGISNIIGKKQNIAKQEGRGKVGGIVDN